MSADCADGCIELLPAISYFWNMKRFLPVLLLLILAECVSAAPKLVVFKGSIAPVYNNTKIYIGSRFSAQDSVLVRNGRFEFKKEFSEARMYLFYSSYEQNAPSLLTVLIEQPGVVWLNIGKSGLKYARIKGSFAQTVYEQFLKERERSVEAAKTANIDSIRFFLHGNPVFSEVDRRLALSYALKYPSTYAAALILDVYGRKNPLADIERAFYQFSKPVQESGPGRRIKSLISGLRSSERGQTVADFSLMDASDKPVRLSEVTNKVVLVNFWASWCSPCREEFKSLRYLYEKHKHKGFTVVSISVDVSPAAWKKALEQEQLSWLQLRDETTGIDVSGGRFGVTALPTTFLLDKTRKILYRDLSTGVMDKVIEALVNE